MKKIIIQVLVLICFVIVLVFLGRPKLSALFYNQAEINLQAGNPKEAIKRYQKAIRVSPEVDFIHYGLGKAYVEDKQPQEAIFEFRKAIKLNPSDIRFYRALVDLYLDRQEFDNTIDVLVEAEKTLGSNKDFAELNNDVRYRYAAELLNSGVDAYEARDKLRANTLLRRAVEIKPDFSQGYYTLGYLYYLDRNFVAAEREALKAVALDKKAWSSYKLLGDIYVQQGNYEKMFNNYDVAIKLNPSNAQLYNDLAFSQMQMEHYKDAITSIRKAIDLEPDNIDRVYTLASLYRDSRLFKDALSIYNRVLKVRQDYPNIHNDIADIYKAQNRDDEATKEFELEIGFDRERLTVDPNDTVTLVNLAYALQGADKPFEAKRIIDKVIALNPGYRHAYITLAKISEKLGDTVGATAALEKAKALSVRAKFIQGDIDRISSGVKN